MASIILSVQITLIAYTFCVSFQTPQIVTNNSKKIVQEIERTKYISKFIINQYLNIQNKIKNKIDELELQRIKELEQPINKFVLTSYSVPNIDSSFKTYTDYRIIGNEGTGQLEIKNNSYTDELGLRRLNGTDEYVIALGTYYCQSAGEHFIITLDTGIVLNCVCGDVKADKDTNKSTHQYITKNGNVVEFHIDSRVADKKMISSGTVGYYDQFKGNIISIQKVTKLN